MPESSYNCLIYSRLTLKKSMVINLYVSAKYSLFLVHIRASIKFISTMAKGSWTTSPTSGYDKGSRVTSIESGGKLGRGF